VCAVEGARCVWAVYKRGGTCTVFEEVKECARCCGVQDDGVCTAVLPVRRRGRSCVSICGARTQKVSSGSGTA